MISDRQLRVHSPKKYIYCTRNHVCKTKLKQDIAKMQDNMLRQGLCDAEMDMVPLPQGKSDGQSWIDANWRTGADKKVSAGKIPGDGSGFFLGQVARPFARAKR